MMVGLERFVHFERIFNVGSGRNESSRGVIRSVAHAQHIGSALN